MKRNSRQEKEEGCVRNIGSQKLLSFCFLLSVYTFICGCSTKSADKDNVVETKETSTKFQQYFVKGEELYLTHCSNCHQKNGTGLGLLFPPLNKSDFMDQHLDEVICLMRYGRKGELIVNGKSFNKEMPGIPSLTDLEIAEIATYIYNSWEHKRGIVEVRDATTILSACKK